MSRFPDPCRNLAEEKIAAICRDYMTPSLSVSVIAMRNGVSKDRITGIIRARGLTERQRGYHSIDQRKKKRRSLAEVFLGASYHKPAPKGADDVLEKAKTALRRRGCVVFNAEVTDGAKFKGFIKCDGRRYTRDELVALAFGREAA